jgi:adenine phosphoribosyltransferase
MSERTKHYRVEVAGVARELPLLAISPNVQIAILNILGDTELIEATGSELAARLRPLRPDLLVTPETKSVPLVHVIARVLSLRYVVLRKEYKPYMGEAVSAETLSITTGKPQTLYLDAKDRALIANKSVVLVDDVISTGSTLQGMRLITDKVGANVIAEAAIFTEGDRAKWSKIIALGHLPVFVEPHD